MCMVCVCYRSGLYNLTCIADNVVSVKQAVELVPVIEFWCDMDLNIRHKRSVDPFSWIQQHWYRSDSITLKSDKKFRECNRVSSYYITGSILSSYLSVSNKPPQVVGCIILLPLWSHSSSDPKSEVNIHPVLIFISF